MRGLRFHLFENREIRRKPVSKKRIIVTAAVGLVSFAGAFVFAWFAEPSPAGRPEGLVTATLGAAEAEPALPQSQADATSKAGTTSGALKEAMTENQLKNLVRDLREKMQAYNDKLQGLEVRERRLQETQDVLKSDIEKLNGLRVELASVIANLKSERDELLKSRLEISQKEKANLASIAAMYDKMDVTGASKILTNICAGVDPNQIANTGGGSFDDAVNILHYMTERTEAKLLAEIAASEPALAAALCQRLKQIVEVD
jgi:hypothetical protein